MQRTWFWPLGLLIAFSMAWPAEENKTPAPPKSAADKPKTPAEEFAAIRDEFLKLQRDLLELMKQNRKPDLLKIIQQAPKRDQYGKRVLELAVHNPKEPFAVEALVWVVVHMRPGPEYDRAFELLEANHVGDSKIGPACMKLGGTATPQAEKFLRLVLEKNTHNEPRGHANFGLAQTLKRKVAIARQKETSKTRQALETAYGKETVRQIQANSDQILVEAEELLRRVLKKHGHVKTAGGTLGAAALDSLFSIATTMKTGPAADLAVDRLVQDYGESEWLTAPSSRSATSPTPAAEKWLRVVLQKSPSPSVKAQACFKLAECLKEQAAIARDLKEGDRETVAEHEAELGKEVLAQLRTVSVEALLKETETLFERVVKEFANVELVRERLKEPAEGELFELRFLAIGKTAPDIEGEDLEGKRFKLSDYRGKVVVLDFWGNW